MRDILEFTLPTKLVGMDAAGIKREMEAAVDQIRGIWREGCREWMREAPAESEDVNQEVSCE